MKKDSFIALRDWAEQLEGLPENDQLELFWAIFRYGLEGEIPQLKTYQNAIFKGFKNDIDRNRQKYDDKIEKRRDAGKKGAEARWNSKNGMAKNSKNGKAIFANSKNGYNDNDNDNDNVDVDDNVDVSSNEDILKKHAKACKKERAFFSAKILEEYLKKSQDENYKKFLLWTKEHTPYIASHIHPLTEEQFNKLRDTYGANTVRICMENIENRKDLRKKYTDLYRTLINWCKREGGGEL